MKIVANLAIAILVLSVGCQTKSVSPKFTQVVQPEPPPIRTAGNPNRPEDLKPESAGLLSSIRPVAHQEESQHPESVAPPELAPAVIEEPAPESILTLDDLEATALANSPAVQQASSQVAAARGEWLQVGLPPNPVVGYSGQQLGSGGQAEQQGVYLGQTFITGKKLCLNRKTAAWKIQQAENRYEAIRLRVLTDVRIGYYEVLIAQKRRELAKQLVEISDQGVTAAEALFRGEEVSEADPLRARVDADNARIVLQNAINEHRAAWRRLAAFVGTPDMPLQYIQGELTPEAIELAWDEQIERILTESPEIAAALANVESANWAVQRARAEVIPDIEVQAVIQDDRGTGSSNANLQVSLPIPIYNRNQGGIKKAIAEAAAAQRSVDRLAMDLQTRLAAAHQRYRSAQNQVEQYSRKGGIVANAQRTLELVRAGYQAEEFDIVDLLTAQRTYFQTNLAYLDSLRELFVSAMEIRGLLLRDSLNSQ